MTRQGSQESEEVTLEDVLVGFLSKYDFLHEYRLQKLVYAAELLYAEENDGEQLVNAEFKPYMYGSYSERLAETLDNLDTHEDIVARPDVHHGKRTEAYKFTGAGDGGLPENVGNLVQRLHEATKSMTNEELAQWSKESWLYQETDYDTPMDFDDYAEKEDRGEINSDIESEFPEAKSEA